VISFLFFCLFLLYHFFLLPVYFFSIPPKKEAIEKLDGILAGYDIDLDAEREERILKK
jgi:hypothetical protein